jgi:hypothetical protein
MGSELKTNNMLKIKSIKCMRNNKNNKKEIKHYSKEEVLLIFFVKIINPRCIVTV